jgi:hypothetical protein
MYANFSNISSKSLNIYFEEVLFCQNIFELFWLNLVPFLLGEGAIFNKTIQTLSLATKMQIRDAIVKAYKMVAYYKLTT